MLDSTLMVLHFRGLAMGLPAIIAIIFAVITFG
jgi:hypothetical protein